MLVHTEVFLHKYKQWLVAGPLWSLCSVLGEQWRPQSLGSYRPSIGKESLRIPHGKLEIISSHERRLLVSFQADMGGILSFVERNPKSLESCCMIKVFVSSHWKEWPQTHQASLSYTGPTERPPSGAEETPPRPSLYRRILRRLASYWVQPQDGEQRGHWRLESPGQLRPACSRPRLGARLSFPASLNSALCVHSAGPKQQHQGPMHGSSLCQLWLPATPSFCHQPLCYCGCFDRDVSGIEIPFWAWPFNLCIKSMR